MSWGDVFGKLLPSWMTGGFKPVAPTSNVFVGGDTPAKESTVKIDGNSPIPYGDTYRGLFSDWFNQTNIAKEDFIRQLQQSEYLHNLDLDSMFKANDFSYQMWLLEKAFNAEEAQKQRDYDERMANTVYTRMVKDLKTAGLNPILALTNGANASQSGGVTPARSSAPSSSNPGAARSSSYRGGQADTSSVISMIANLASTVAMASVGLYKANLSSATSIYNNARRH